ncbi:MAG: hypothetical protein RIT19_1564, partial [Verrucomicrobiota bacterium]
MRFWVGCLWIACLVAWATPLGRAEAEVSKSRTSGAEWLAFDGESREIRELVGFSKVPAMAISADGSSLVQLTRLVHEKRPRILHIVAHGRPGAVLLGGKEWITEASLRHHASDLRGWSVEHIVLWSCRAGADDEFIRTLEALTGARISASIDPIGHPGMGAAWRLTRNSVGVENPFPQSALDSWRHTLATAYLHGLYLPTASGDPDGNFDEETSSVTINRTPVSVKGVTFYQAGAQFSGNNVTGTLSWIDANGNAHSQTVEVTRPIKDGSRVQGLYAWVDNAPVGGQGGPEDRAWILSVDNPYFNATSAISSSSDPVDTALNGLLTSGNQPPTTTGIATQSGVDATAFSLATASFFTDPNGDSLTWTATGLPSGLTIHPTTGVISGTLDKNASASGPYTVSITVTDPFGALVTTTFTLNVTNPAPNATDDSASTATGTAVSGTVATNDSDPDGDALTFSKTTDPSNGTVTMAGNGSYTYTPNTGFSGTDQFTYTATDANNATDTATVTISVGVPATAPVTTGLSNQTGTDATSFSYATAGAFSDPNGDTLTYSATGLPAGLSIDPVTGLISGTIDKAASGSGPYTVTVTAKDPGNATVATTFTLVVSNPLPVAVNDTA